LTVLLSPSPHIYGLESEVQDSSPTTLLFKLSFCLIVAAAQHVESFAYCALHVCTRHNRNLVVV